MFPWLGHTLGFVTSKPGAFWTSIQDALPAKTGGACRVVLGGQRSHLLFSTVSMAALTQNRALDRHKMSRDVGMSITGSTQYDQDLHTLPYANKSRSLDEEIFNEHLLRTDRVAELTARYMTELRVALTDGAVPGTEPDQAPVAFQAWLWPLVFQARISTFFGRGLLDGYPSIPKDYLAYEEGVTRLLCGYPQWLAPGAYRALNKLLGGLSRWLSATLEVSAGKIPDPSGDLAWDERWGSRVIRGYHRNSQSFGQSPRRAAPALVGFLFALNANTGSATLWTLIHLLDTSASDPTLLPRVRAEVESVRELASGTLDVKQLMEKPLLQSVYAEVLRLYVDVTIMRNLKADVTVPIDYGGDDAPRVRLLKGDMAVAPSWTVHHDSDAWPGVSPNHFDGERFLVADEKGEKVFSMGSTRGRWMPYGGGRPMCPGRLFAKQEIMVAVAMVLRMYDFEMVGYADGQGKRTDKFPGMRSKLPGTGIGLPDGDILVRIKRRTQSSMES
ncbi:MAG: hypothetical protein Q9206_000144 [Seirophora lacunosa]